MSWWFFITSVCIYAGGIYFLLQYRKGEEDKTAPAASIPSVIAIPRNYVINIIENTSDIDYRKYADLSLNISDIIKNNELATDNPENENKKEVKISYENTDFSDYVNINTKKT